MTGTSRTERSPRTGSGSLPELVGRRRALWTSSIGSAIEWFDFYLYSTAAALVFGPLFFPPEWAAGGTVAAFATYAVGFVARPVGGIVAGHLGDRIGRKSMLVITLGVMGAATFLIGVLPTYETAGVWAPAALVILRLLQGIGVGGEWGGGVLVAVENAPPRRRGLFSSAPLIGFPLGLMLANATFALLLLMPRDDLLAYGWRIPFLLSIVLVGIGVRARLGLDETPEFRSAVERRAVAAAPVTAVLRTAPRQVLSGALVSLGVAGIVSYFTVYLVSVGPPSSDGSPLSPVLLGLIVGALLQCVSVPLYTMWCDRREERLPYTMAAGFALSILLAFPALSWVRSGSIGWSVTTFVLAMAVAHGAAYGNLATFLTNAFRVEHRYSAIAVTYQVGATVASFVPLILAVLHQSHPGFPAGSVLVVTSAAGIVGIVIRVRHPARDPARQPSRGNG